MAWSIDARIPVRLGVLADAGVGDAILIEGRLIETGAASEGFDPAQQAQQAHAASCDCCAGRSPAAQALDRLFQRRARGETAFFRRVVAVTRTEAGDLEVWSALRNDVIASARFRLDDGHRNFI